MRAIILISLLMSMKCIASCDDIASPSSIGYDKCIGQEIIDSISVSKKDLSVNERKAFIDQVFKIEIALKYGWKDVASSYIDSLPIDGKTITKEGVDAIKEKLK